MHTFSKTLMATALSVAAVYTQAMELELPIGFGLSAEPLIAYSMSDGSVREFRAGQGLGLLVSDEVTRIGSAAIKVKGGLQYGFMNTPVTTTEDLKDRFYYFPVYASVSLPIGTRAHLSAGVNTLLMPRYTQQYQDAKDVFRLRGNLGYSIDFSYDVVPATDGDPLALYYFARYESNSAQFVSANYSDGSSQTFSASMAPLDVSAGYIGLGFRF